MTNDAAGYLIDRYKKLREEADQVALELEQDGYTGYYIRLDTQEMKPLDPKTRPTDFVFKK